MSPEVDLSKYRRRIARANRFAMKGRVRRVRGVLVESSGPPSRLGDLCRITDPLSGTERIAEVVGFERNHYYLMPFSELEGISPGWEIVSTGKPLSVSVGPELKGRILNGVGQPIDGKGPLKAALPFSLSRRAPEALERRPIDRPFRVGVRAIDLCLPIGHGQRIGIFSGSGVGKSTLLGMMGRGSQSDLNVIALIGERGREVREFIEKVLGEKGLGKSVVVVVTSDEPSIMRIKGAYTATAIAEYFREEGKSVLFLLDSITRFAMAQRELGLSLGEPPTTKGYPPSVFGILPRLLERTGMGKRGSITAFYTVLVDADDFNEPISDACRAILDGHLVLNRALAAQNHYPAIDLLQSVSRSAEEIALPKQLELSRKLKRLVAVYEEARDLINIGAYVKGSNPEIDAAVASIDAVNALLRQDLKEITDFDASMKKMEKIFEPASGVPHERGRG
jgi:flagellum-specific ATP synthase